MSLVGIVVGLLFPLPLGGVKGRAYGVYLFIPGGSINKQIQPVDVDASSKKKKKDAPQALP